MPEKNRGNWWARANKITKILIALIGLIASIIAIYQVIPDTPDEELDILTLENDSLGLFPAAYAAEWIDEVEITSENVAQFSNQQLIAAKKIKVDGNVLLKSGLVVVANDLAFTKGAKITIPSGEITVIAPRMSHVVIDVSGNDGIDGQTFGAAGTNGSHGGGIFLASAQLIESSLHGNGGHGGSGHVGANGQNGRSGKCKGFGGWRKAENGGPGSPGGLAGTGGNGGRISVLYRYTPPYAEAALGNPGSIGKGGEGGSGGSGCTGVGGSQDGRSQGRKGADGANGQDGRQGIVNARKVRFGPVIEAFNRWRKSEDRSPDTLRAQLNKIPTEDD